MSAFIPPVAPSCNAVERLGPGHHTPGTGTPAAIFYSRPLHPAKEESRVNVCAAATSAAPEPRSFAS
jgi:hypothetical protein